MHGVVAAAQGPAMEGWWSLRAREIALLFPRSFLFFLSKKREFVAFPPSRHHGGGASVLHAHKDDADAGAGG